MTSWADARFDRPPPSRCRPSRAAAGGTDPRATPGRAEGTRRRADRRLVLARRPRRPGGPRLSRGRERLHRGDHGPDRPPAGRALRGDRGTHRGDRFVGAGPQGSLAVLQPHGRGEQLRHPLSSAGAPRMGRRAAPGRARPSTARRRGDPRRREPPRGRPRVLRARQPVGQSRSQLDGVLDRHHRGRALHDALRRPRRRIGVARIDRGHLVRGGVGERQPHRLLRPGRRGDASLPALAARGGDRSG